MLATPALLILMACGTSNIQTDDTGTSDTDTNTNTNSDQAPAIDSANAYCYYHSTGDPFYQWAMDANVDDPQGRDTIETSNTVEVYRSDTLQASYGLVCGPTNPCIGSFKESDNGIACDSASEYVFLFLVSDEDGNTTSLEVTGSQQ